MKYGDAIKHCLTADQLAIENNQPDMHIEILVYTGTIYQKMGFSIQALEYFREAQKIAEENKYQVVSNDLHYYIGSVYHDIGDTIASRNNLLISLADSKIK